MGSTFNPQILVEKLNKLNSSQASIETLSHWCIFHMHKAKQVVETWDRQFHCSPPEQRLAFLYLANDILQNSRRKGSEFVGEFWKVLPGALRDVIENGNEFGRNAARRLINIWDERKVFGSRGQTLKEELVGKHLDYRNEKHLSVKLKHPVGNSVEKIVSGYQVVYGGPIDEDTVLATCKTAITAIDKVEKEVNIDIHSEQLNGSALVEELQGQHATLRNCIEQLTAKELARASLVSYLREALQEQESKLAYIRNELQTARTHSDQAGNICQQLLAEHNPSGGAAASSMGAPGFIPADTEQSAPVMYNQNLSIPDRLGSGQIEGNPRKSAAAAVAAKLTSSASSAQMLSYVFSSLASEASTASQTKEPSSDLPPEKKSKHEIDQSYTPHHLQSPPDSLQNNMTTQQMTQDVPPPPPSSPPPPPPPPMQTYQVPQYVQNAGMSFSYNMTTPPPPTLPGYPSVAPPPLSGMGPFAPPPNNSYPAFQGSDGNFYNQPSSMPMAPISRQ